MNKTKAAETKDFKILLFKQLQCNRNISRNGFYTEKDLYEKPYHLLIF